jgi:hypothetical protein
LSPDDTGAVAFVAAEGTAAGALKVEVDPAEEETTVELTETEAEAEAEAVGRAKDAGTDCVTDAEATEAEVVMLALPTVTSTKGIVLFWLARFAFGWGSSIVE